ncbi:hypothetical protein [Bifidobacterium simiarum]|nr:hypothetical protein [Bifidobacterium simiarum]
MTFEKWLDFNVWMTIRRLRKCEGNGRLLRYGKSVEFKFNVSKK